MVSSPRVYRLGGETAISIGVNLPLLPHPYPDTPTLRHTPWGKRKNARTIRAPITGLNHCGNGSGCGSVTTDLSRTPTGCNIIAGGGTPGTYRLEPRPRARVERDVSVGPAALEPGTLAVDAAAQSQRCSLGYDVRPRWGPGGGVRLSGRMSNIQQGISNLQLGEPCREASGRQASTATEFAMRLDIGHSNAGYWILVLRSLGEGGFDCLRTARGTGCRTKSLPPAPCRTTKTRHET